MKGIVVQQSDLPSDWKGTPSAPETDKDKDIDAQLSACVGSSNSGEQDQIQQVRSDDFARGQSTVSSDVSSYKSDSDVQTQVAQLKNPKAQSCLNTLFKKEVASTLPSTATIKSIGIKLNTSNGGIANLIGSANGTVVVTVKGRTISIYIGAAFFTGRQLTGEVNFSSIGTPISSSFANPIVEAVVQRASNA